MTTENSDSEEEILVYAEFKNNINIENHKNVHVLGIDTKNPVFQLDDTLYIVAGLRIDRILKTAVRKIRLVSTDLEAKIYPYLDPLSVDPDIKIHYTFLTIRHINRKFENPLGTYMFFGEDHSPQSLDPLFDKLPDKSLKYLYKTRKFLSLQHAFITPKEDPEKETELTQTEENDNIVPIKFNNLPEALDHFKKEWSSKEGKE